MNDFSIRIGNEAVVRPGVYTTVNDRKMTPPRGNVLRRMVIVDVARGGVVGGVTTVSSERDVQVKLAGGSGAQLCLTALKRGVPNVDFVRVNAATPATLDLGDIVLTAVGYGLQGRALQARRSVSAARADAHTLTLNDTRTGRTETYESLGPVLDVRYAGIGTAPAITVSKASGVTTVALSVTGGATQDTVSYTSDMLGSAQDLADALNTTGAWTARAVGNTAAVTAPLTDLKTGALTAVAGVLTLTLGAAGDIRALEDSALATAALKETPTTALFSTEYAFFTGGGEGGTPTVQEWVDALAVTETGKDIYGVVLGTGDPAVIGAALGQARRLSGVKRRKERTIYAGPPLSANKTALKTASLELAATLGDMRLIVLTEQGRDYDVVTGKKIRVSAAAFAADACAAYLTGPVEKNLTNVACGIPEREFEWGDDDVDLFLNSGVMPVATDLDDNTAVYVQGITSYTTDANVMRRKISGLGIRDYLAQQIRKRLKRFVGAVGDETTVSEIATEIAGVLNEETRSGPAPTGVLTAGEDPVTGEPRQAWENLVLVMDGFDLVAAQFECHPVGEVAYIHPEISFTPVRIRATA